jgi:hypothetical protein
MIQTEYNYIVYVMFTPLGLLDPEGGGTTLLQNISNCLLVDMGLHPRRLGSSSTLL